jgi:hypothetical protein
MDYSRRAHDRMSQLTAQSPQSGQAMRRKSQFLLLALPATILFASTFASAAPLMGNVVQREFNGATGTTPGATSPEDLSYTHHVFAGETVSTPAGGSTVIRFHDQTQLQVGADSTVVLGRPADNADGGSANGKIKLTKGVFRYIGRQARGELDAKLTTPMATLTARGTKFIVYVRDDGTTDVSVLEGQVEIKPCGTGAAVSAEPGQAFEVTTSCTAVPISAYTVPADDPAITSDYSVSDALGRDQH